MPRHSGKAFELIVRLMMINTAVAPVLFRGVTCTIGNKHPLGSRLIHIMSDR